MSNKQGNRPNILLIMADDMGFSDLGCYGSEIDTPNLDKLAANGARFSQMYNCARCCPTRASILTGLYPHQAGVGHMVNDAGVGKEYQGFLRDDCITIAEALKSSSYHTLLSGKWHVGGAYQANKPETWSPGEPEHPIPTQRGFDEFYGMLGGGGSYFNPPYMMRNEELIEEGGGGYYLTDAISENAVQMLRDVPNDEPFFLYVAYTAPHWPLHALPEDIEKYVGRYLDAGWDGVRQKRYENLKKLGLLNNEWALSPRDPSAPPWKDTPNKEWEDLRMAVYAAQVDRMDQGIGRIMAELEKDGKLENTLIMFLSDNGGCAEFLAEDTNHAEPFRYDIPTHDGRPMRIGNTPKIKPGPDDTFMSYDLPWANASNSPFRLFKHWVHEGGISTPFIVHWPGKVRSNQIFHNPIHIVDIMATCLDVSGTVYPTEYNGKAITPLEGESFAPLVFGNREWQREEPIFWEHEGNRAVRAGKWKLVCKYPGKWELYNMEVDRTELNDLSGQEPAVVEELSKLYEQWATRCGVREWPLKPHS
ncbi:MAG: arylsulfatase [Firmicutes bacterium]|nr:arylsulfatase [Bacillota bacterium]